MNAGDDEHCVYCGGPAEGGFHDGCADQHVRDVMMWFEAVMYTLHTNPAKENSECQVDTNSSKS